MEAQFFESHIHPSRKKALPKLAAAMVVAGLIGGALLAPDAAAPIAVGVGVTYNKFETFVGDIGLKVHELNADLLEIYLSNAAPSTSADSIKTDLAEITNENGYAAPVDTVNTYSETTGTGTLAGTDVVVTASGGTVGPFRYAVLFNTTPTSPLDPLIAWWDYGSGLTLNDGESFTVDFGASIFTFT